MEVNWKWRIVQEIQTPPKSKNDQWPPTIINVYPELFLVIKMTGKNMFDNENFIITFHVVFWVFNIHSFLVTFSKFGFYCFFS